MRTRRHIDLRADMQIAFIILLALGLASAGYIGWSPSYSVYSRPVVRRVYSYPRWSGSSGWNKGWNGGWNGWNGGWNNGWW
ncbi:hypothetical protein MSG28_004437 [Choristoneura fumiferana]|uniref:Uncharacterized protein n=1 Tax=Choristoneura fumiferana TaxID=7141 RepID=A0ACC0K639_CHOFU|nr:hypothetical protein MSG28_004437 [Choristoneura fumiferana]